MRLLHNYENSYVVKADGSPIVGLAGLEARLIVRRQLHAAEVEPAETRIDVRSFPLSRTAASAMPLSSVAQ